MKLNYLIRNPGKFKDVILKLGLHHVVTDSEIKTLDDLFLQISRLRDKDTLLQQISRRLIAERLKTIICPEVNQDETGFFEKKAITALIPKNKTLQMAREIRALTGWKLPVTVMSLPAVLLAIGIFALWLIIVVFFFRKSIEIFLVTIDLFSILIPLLLIPGVISIKLMPGVFDTHQFYQLNTMEDLITNIHKLNSKAYEETNYHKMRTEISSLYGPL